ncbi:hypothetical protein PFICI_05884 [Pestalotiopsis fici W106-1]|uniref:SGNH hydrolase-type esterase domain-containing protein n=1 Tax=Pestalotiopsis fici (strain W106-1 / CGMCC3.15140) TaxID=1229662 RepID=W3XD37_PESFW|nr:uncharacterized protein PFICI_05884 [Pestalotiopsis fici W106-1]ETS84008.1 hypothetical protein PFICI_05884 [Pestalotiopsis fici W106-1]
MHAVLGILTLILGWRSEASIIRNPWGPGSHSDSYQHVLDQQHSLEVPKWSTPAAALSKTHHHHRPRAGFVALGDSYSAGIGTGVDGAEDECRRGLHAYPALIAKDLSASQGGLNNTSFQFLSCTGATTNELLLASPESQINNLNGSLPVDFALMSVGGNDLGFFEVMNACIFRFYNFYSGTCESALEHAQERLNGTEFEERLRIAILELLNRVKWEKKPWFFITVTGYARFFNDQTPECDEMSLGVWWRGPKLQRELRVRMNIMVQAVNEKIKATVAKINSQFAGIKVLFVDYDSEFEGHRFCEPGVVEPDYQRNDTYFFLVGGPDNARNDTSLSQKAQPDVLPLHSDLVDPRTCLEPATRSGDWGLLALCYMAMSKAEDSTLRHAHTEVVAENSMWYVPTYYGKTFHPRTLGHEIIRDKIYNLWHELGL